MPVRFPIAPTSCAGALLALSLQACTAIEPLPPTVSAPPRIEVTSASYRHLVHFETDRGRPTPTEAAQLASFLASLPEGDARISFVVAGHADERGPLAANAELAKERAMEVARLIRAGGFPDATVSISSRGEHAPVATGGSTAAYSQNRRVEVAAEVIEPRVTGCPAGTHDLRTTAQNYPFPGLGCADLGNLVRMLDDPRDLVAGRSTTAADGTRESEAIVRYRTDKVKPLLDAEFVP